MSATQLREPSVGNADSGSPQITTSTGNTPALVRTGKSVAQLEAGIAHYPDPIRIEVIWLQGFFLDHCRNNIEALVAIAAKLGHEKSREYFRNLICGDYFKSKSSTWVQGGRGWSEFLDIMGSVRRYAQQVARSGQIAFVQNPTYFAIDNFITAKRSLSAVCKFGGIVGPTGSGKSESYKFYRTLNNHGAVIHVESPADGRLSALKAKIAAAYHVGESTLKRGGVGVEAAIRDNVNETRCIIIDNVQDLYDPRTGAKQTCFNWLREIQDDTRCTIILSFTEEFLNGTLTSGLAKGFFEQFIGRMGGEESILRLPLWPTVADLEYTARSFGLEPGKGAMAIVDKWGKRPGRIRIVFDKLQLAQTFALQDGRGPITLADLGAADAYRPPNAVLAAETDGKEGAT